MKIIELTQGKSVRVSDCDYEYLIGMGRWYYANGYAMRDIYSSGKRETIYMYKVILERIGVTFKKLLKITNKLDYRQEALIPPLDLSPGPKEILLTQGRVALVDLEDYEYLMQWNWYFNSCGYAVRMENRKIICMHRAVLERMGFKDFEQVDHINHDTLDNHKCNLRPATNQENCRNRSSIIGTSKYKGVSWNKRDKKWIAQIKMGDKQKNLGYFINEKEAALMYNTAAKKYFGEYALFNEIGE